MRRSRCSAQSKGDFTMKRISLAIAATIASAASVAAVAAAGPITRQNGSTPLFNNFTSICAVAGYANYGLCGGDPTAFTNVTGRINAVQAKVGVWTLGLSFSNLQPGASYKLWGNQTAGEPKTADISGFFPVGVGTAALDGTLRFSYQTTSPTNLGFDLNMLERESDQYGVTIVTSYWSSQTIQVLNADGTLYVPGS
jgi:hypothetical protein